MPEQQEQVKESSSLSPKEISERSEKFAREIAGALSESSQFKEDASEILLLPFSDRSLYLLYERPVFDLEKNSGKGRYLIDFRPGGRKGEDHSDYYSIKIEDRDNDGHFEEVFISPKELGLKHGKIGNLDSVYQNNSDSASEKVEAFIKKFREEVK